LLDDVMSELDETRRHTLASFVGEAAQTVMTTTNLGYFDSELVSRARVVAIP
jgi:DNA replication and repair protein RecF